MKTLSKKKQRTIQIMQIIENKSYEMDVKEYCQLRDELARLDNQIWTEENRAKRSPNLIKLNGAWPGGKHPMNAII